MSHLQELAGERQRAEFEMEELRLQMEATLEQRLALERRAIEALAGEQRARAALAAALSAAAIADDDVIAPVPLRAESDPGASMMVADGSILSENSAQSAPVHTEQVEAVTIAARFAKQVPITELPPI
jgi:hypothetical protein